MHRWVTEIKWNHSINPPRFRFLAACWYIGALMQFTIEISCFECKNWKVFWIFHRLNTKIVDSSNIIYVILKLKKSIFLFILWNVHKKSTSELTKLQVENNWTKKSIDQNSLWIGRFFDTSVVVLIVAWCFWWHVPMFPSTNTCTRRVK